MFTGDLVVPTTFSKRDAAYGSGGSVRGVRRDPEQISKGIAMPLHPPGIAQPVKKAPVLARTGPKPTKALTPPTSRLAGLVSKAQGPRYETPEDRRQRRLGAMSAGAAGGGALQVSRGVRQVRSDTASVKGSKSSIFPAKRVVPGREVSDETRGRMRKLAERVAAADRRGAAVVRPQAAGRLAGGAALIGAGAGLMRERHKRGWK